MKFLFTPLRSKQKILHRLHYAAVPKAAPRAALAAGDAPGVTGVVQRTDAQ